MPTLQSNGGCWKWILQSHIILPSVTVQQCPTLLSLLIPQVCQKDFLSEWLREKQVAEKQNKARNIKITILKLHRQQEIWYLVQPTNTCGHPFNCRLLYMDVIRCLVVCNQRAEERTGWIIHRLSLPHLFTLGCHFSLTYTYTEIYYIS